MGFLIRSLAGVNTKASDLGMRVTSFEPEGVNVENTFAEVTGRPGNVDQGARHAPRRIVIEGKFQAMSRETFPLYRDRINALFASLDTFYVSDDRQPFKRWLVRVDGVVNLTQYKTSATGTYSITLITVGVPYARSKVTNQQVVMEWANNSIGWGMGFNWGENVTYSYTGYTFTETNHGNVTVDPRFMDLEIEITFNGSATGAFELNNLTTGDSFRYEGSYSAGDKLTLDGIYARKNSINVDRDTNLKHIRLAPGANNFQVWIPSGSFTVKFLYNYYYQ